MVFWAAGAVGLVALAAVGWYLYRDTGTPSGAPPAVRGEVVAAQPAPAAAPAVVPATEPAAAVLPPPVVVAPPIAAAPHVVAAPAAAVPASATQQSAAAPDEEAPSSRSSRRASARRAASSPAPVPPAPGVPPTGAAPAVAEPAAVTGLPAGAPKLAISGGVYSANVAQRMLIVNGQVFNEGSEIGTGVVLEEIKPKAAVLKFRGSRYTVTY